MDNLKTIEERLKEFILLRYRSIREFANHVDMPYSTIDNIFKRGVNKAHINNVINVCRALGISTDALAQGDITPSNLVNGEYTHEEKKLIENFRSLNAQGKEYIDITMVIAVKSDLLSKASNVLLEAFPYVDAGSVHRDSGNNTDIDGAEAPSPSVVDKAIKRIEVYRAAESTTGKEHGIVSETQENIDKLYKGKRVLREEDF